jgi:hypothetical protein
MSDTLSPSEAAGRADERIRAATLLINALAEHMPAGPGRTECADAIKLHILGPALVDMETAADDLNTMAAELQAAEAAVLRPWICAVIGAALLAAVFYVHGALAFIGACHDAGIPTPDRWPF